MKSDELKEKHQRAQEKVEKCKKTIERHKVQAKKKADILLAVGWLDITNPNEHKWNEEERKKYQKETGRDLYWDFCDYEHKLEDIKGAEKKLRDAEIICKNWEEKYNKQVSLEHTIAFKMPPVFQSLKEALKKEWVESDIKRRDEMNRTRKEVDWKTFRQMYSYNLEISLTMTDEEFEIVEEREAETYITDLYNRVKSQTGEVTNWDNIQFNGKALNGYVEGEHGKVMVETIVAGGYNVQREHYRVLVKPIREEKVYSGDVEEKNDNKPKIYKFVDYYGEQKGLEAVSTIKEAYDTAVNFQCEIMDTRIDETVYSVWDGWNTDYSEYNKLKDFIAGINKGKNTIPKAKDKGKNDFNCADTELKQSRANNNNTTAQKKTQERTNKER